MPQCGDSVERATDVAARGGEDDCRDLAVVRHDDRTMLATAHKAVIFDLVAIQETARCV